MKHVKRILSRLENVRKSGNGWMASCPCSDHGAKGRGDKDPSLHISLGEGNKIMLYCFGGCNQDDIRDELGIDYSDLYPQDGDIDSEHDDLPDVPVQSTTETDTGHKVYSRLLEQLPLSEQHRVNLRKRGLTDKQIDHNGYRSLTFFGLKQATVKLREEFGNELLSVPGFTEDDETIKPVKMPNGMIIPVRDCHGQIIALKLRKDDDQNGKYIWFSGGDTTCGSPTHVPLGVSNAEVVRVTEGPLKADVTTALDSTPTIAVSGVSSWANVLPVLIELGAKTVRLAFDADSQEKGGVANTLRECYETLKKTCTVEIETWPLEQGKGIDDLLMGGGNTKILTGETADNYVQSLPGNVEEERRKYPLALVEPVSITVENEEQEPEKFPYGIEEPDAFPLECFPEPLQELTNEISASIGCPVDFPACVMLNVAAVAIGRSREIEPKRGWKISSRMYMGIVGEPGDGKTPAIRMVMAPLFDQGSRWLDEYKEEKEVFADAKQVFEAERKAFVKDVEARATSSKRRSKGSNRKEEKPDGAALVTRPDNELTSEPASSQRQRPSEEWGPPKPPKPPVPRRIIVNDVTTEALSDIMNQNPRGIILSMDELTGFIGKMNAYRGGQGADRQFYLSSWSGEPAQVDRKNQDEPILVKRPFLNILGGIQPEMLNRLENKKGQDGFIHRFLFSFPISVKPSPWDSKGVSPNVRDDWGIIVNWLLGLAMRDSDQPNDSEPIPRLVTITDEAMEIWAEWYDRHKSEMQWNCFPSHLRGVWSKFPAQAFSILLVVHMLKVAYAYLWSEHEYHQIDPPIDADSMHRALALADYFKDHAVRVLDRLKVSPDDMNAQQVLAWVQKRPGKKAKARELQQYGVAGIKTASVAKAILKDLEDRGLGTMHSEKGKNRNGRTTEYFVAA